MPNFWNQNVWPAGPDPPPSWLRMYRPGCRGCVHGSSGPGGNKHFNHTAEPYGSLSGEIKHKPLRFFSAKRKGSGQNEGSAPPATGHPGLPCSWTGNGTLHSPPEPHRLSHRLKQSCPKIKYQGTERERHARNPRTDCLKTLHNQGRARTQSDSP